LVRGLDYYCHTAFEFTTDALGAQGTVLAGGRYDSLIKTMGGPATPGIGWAAGVERLSMLVEDVPAKARPIALIPMGEAAEARVQELSNTLRRADVAVDVAYGGTMKKRMKRANTVNASHAVILGDDELARNEATVRDLDSGEQQAVSLDTLVSMLGAL
jgi:histidyl-tRNA synthetase